MNSYERDAYTHARRWWLRAAIGAVLVIGLLWLGGCVNMVPEDYCLDVANQQVVFTWELGDD